MAWFQSKHLDELALRGLSAETIYQRKRNLIRLERALGKLPVEATAADLLAWRAGLRVADETVIAYVSHVREYFAWLQATGIRDDNPAAALPVPRIGRRLPRPIGEANLFDALDAAPARIRAMIVLAGWAGLRAKEIALLRRSAVLDTAAPPVLLIASDATKGRHERIVPLSAFVLDELRPVLPAAGWVFRRLDGRPGPNTPGLISKLCNEHLHACGFPETLHQLRHRFGTGAWRTSRDLRVVQELMGHRHPSTTAGYVAFDNADARAAVEGLPSPRHLRLLKNEKGV